MNIATVHAQGLAYVQTEAGSACPTFKWSGNTWLCLPGGAHKRKDLQMGGFNLNSDLMLTALVAQFGLDAVTLREKMLNTELDYLGLKYKVVSIIVAIGGQQIRIECNDLMAGA